MRSKIFSGQICRQIYEVRVVRKFRRLEGQEIWEGGRVFRILSPVRNVFLNVCVDCVSYTGDYSTDRLVHSITVVLHVVEILINIRIY
jgi:hypothetical protein